MREGRAAGLQHSAFYPRGCYLRSRWCVFRARWPSPLTFCLCFPPEKLAEAQRRFTTLRTELQSTLDAQKEASGASTLPRRRKPVFHLSHEERVQHRNIRDLKLAFSELYLSLILLQNYQVPAESPVCKCLGDLCVLELPHSVFHLFLPFLGGALNTSKEKTGT